MEYELAELIREVLREGACSDTLRDRLIQAVYRYDEIQQSIEE